MSISTPRLPYAARSADGAASRLRRPLGALLLVGTLLLGGGAALHPALTGDAVSQLRTIAGTAHWRPLHLMMLAGVALVAGGIWVRLLLPREGSGDPLVAGLALVTVGVAINALNIAYMAGAGWHLAEAVGRGEAGAAPLFAATHPIGLVAARFGNLLLALGAFVLGWAERLDDGSARLYAVLAWVAAAGGVLGVLCFDEGSPFAFAGVALLSAWQLATAVRSLKPSPPEPDG